MTKNEILEKIEELKNQISDLEKEVEKVGNEGEKKYPADGTTFYFLDTCGQMDCDSWGSWAREETTKRMKLMFDSGEISLTREGIEEYAEVKQVERELFALADDPWEWDGEHHHCALACTRNNEVNCGYFSNIRMNIPYFKNGESAMAAVEKVGEERVKKWLTYKRKRPEIH